MLECQFSMAIAFRHGTFVLNERSELTGQAALLAIQQGIPPNADATMGLMTEGRQQGLLVRQALSEFAIDACLYSPTLRTTQMAEIVLKDRILPGGMHPDPGLVERDRGVFSFMPDELARQHPAYHLNKESTLHWRPQGGKTIYEVMQNLLPVIRRANQLAPGGCIAFSTHAETMLGLRALLGRMDDERFDSPLIPCPPRHIQALQKAKWIGRGQMDIYAEQLPHTRQPLKPRQQGRMNYLRSISVTPKFDTGWMKLADN